jgi:uncharacterized lipoprotein YajG
LCKIDLVNSIVDYKGKLVLGTALLVTLLIFTAAITTTTTIQNVNAAVNESDKPGNVVNSKYLSITDHKYRSGQFSDTITGTIMNNSTQEISSVNVYVALYDKDNKLITMESGSVSISPLRAGDNSPFTIIPLLSFSNVKDNIHHYIIFPGGTPR